MGLSDTTGLYFYSALLQADAALLAVTGLFVVFKLQSIQALTLSLRAWLHQVTGPADRRDLVAFDTGSLEDKERIARKHSGQGVMSYLEHELPFHRESLYLKGAFRPIAWELLAALTVCILGIILATTIHGSWPECEPWLLLLVGLGHAVVVLRLIRRCHRILKGGPTDH